MSKKVSEIMDDLAYEWLEEVEGIELEGDKRLQEIAFDRVKQKALEGIQVEDVKFDKVVRLSKKRRKSKKIVKKVLLPLVAALSLVGITVVAINSSDTLGKAFEALFGEALPFVQSEIQDIAKSVTEKGVTFTAEAAAIENKAGLFIVSFENEDGSLFEEGVSIKELSPELEKRGALGWSTQPMIIDEGRQLTYILDVSGDKKLYGQTIGFKAKDLGRWHEETVEVPINLAKAYEETLVGKDEKETWETYKGKTGINIKLLEAFPEYRLDRVEFDGEEFGLVTSQPSKNGEEGVEATIRLIDTRTNEEIQGAGGSGSWYREQEERRNIDKFVGVTEENLPYLKVEIEYRYFEVSVEGEWQVSFELDKNENVKEQKLFKRIKTEDISVTLHDLEVSKLGVKVEGWRHKGYLDELDGYIQMKDGTKIGLEPSGASSKWNLLFEKQYRIGEVLGDEAISEQQEVEIIQDSQRGNREGGTTSNGLFERSISVTTQFENGEVSMPNFIKIEDVEYIVLEGVAIPID